jgi:hypothetical protein
MMKAGWVEHPIAPALGSSAHFALQNDVELKFGEEPASRF